MLDLVRNYAGYFLLGGIIVSLTTFFGSKGHGFWAAFVAQFPSISVLTFFLIYRNGGNTPMVHYAKGFIYTVPAWILYVLAVVLLCDRIGIWWSLGIGITLYVTASMLLAQFK